MVSNQKSIFDKEPVKSQTRKETKTKDDFIPFEESIFALNKKSKSPVRAEQTVPKEGFVPIEDTIFCQKKIFYEEDNKDDEDTKLLEHDDEVPFEESIFAKNKGKTSSSSKLLSKDTKIDLEALFNKYKDIYMNEYISNVRRLNLIDANVFNNCCVLLEESRKTKVMNVEAYDIVKRVIMSACTCTEDAFYCYANMNKTLLELIRELCPDIDIYTTYHILDKSYAEVIDEFGGKRWQK